MMPDGLDDLVFYAATLARLQSGKVVEFEHCAIAGDAIAFHFSDDVTVTLAVDEILVSLVDPFEELLGVLEEP
jgi:hypothetical protein